MRRPRWLLLRRSAPVAPPTEGTLAPFNPAARGTWEWRQPSIWRAEWTLFVDASPVASLVSRGALGRAAVGWTANERWTLRTKFPTNLVVTHEGTEDVLARYRAAWLRGGRVEREGRETLLWRHEDFWGARYGLQTSDKLPLLHVHSKRRVVRRDATIEIEDAARRLPDLPLMTVLAWHLVLLSRRSHYSYP